MDKALKEKKYELVEKLGVHFEHSQQLAPVAARILAFVILTGKFGVTFDDLVCGLGASKSTISTHLNHLQDLQRISYFTKKGDRKKYFVTNSDGLIQSIENMMAQWELEKNLHQEISDYKLEINNLEATPAHLEFELTFHENYIKFLNLALASMMDLKSKIAALKTQTLS
ncbi:GbsR/MarR family transcriptional regulator [Bizionia sediminis]|uniref:GbsR/MarR family transcriptional regulator n=1 Tax=Bizionia sediminis TaxID=1737064 RepID=A0ABW5KUH5_9FLAO